MNENELIKRLLEIEKELLERKRKNKIFSYNTEIVHQKQVEFHNCKKRNRWVFGGNRSGKTECGAAEAVYMARGIHPYRKNRHEVTGWIVSLSQQVQRDVAQSKFLNYLNPDWIEDIVMLAGSKSNASAGVIDFVLIRTVSGGISKIGFKNCDQGREKFQGTSLDFVWFDEEPPQDIYEECLMRVLDRRGDIFGTMTPLKGLSWVYEGIYINSGGDPDIWCIFMEWADNPYLDKNEIEKLTQSLSKSELESRRYGKFRTDKGMVYPEFSEGVHIIEPFAVPKEWYDKLSIDPGLHNPLSCHWYAVDGDGNVYVVDEHYAAMTDIGTHARAIKAHSKALGWHYDREGRIEALIDSASTQRTLAASKSVAELFFDNGIAVNTRVNKDLWSGIARVKEYLIGVAGKSKLYIFSNCINLIREFKTYWWGSGDVPRKKDDHALDELRYYIMSRPESYRPPVIKGAILKDKERLIRQVRLKNRVRGG